MKEKLHLLLGHIHFRELPEIRVVSARTNMALASE